MNPFENFDVISRYSRAQAIEDGVLVDVSETAREAGIRLPVAVTSAVWSQYVSVPERVQGIQSESGRLWDIVFLLRHAMPREEREGPFEFPVKLYVANTRAKAKPVVLKAHIGPGDDGALVITIMLPEED